MPCGNPVLRGDGHQLNTPGPSHLNELAPWLHLPLHSTAFPNGDPTPAVHVLSTAQDGGYHKTFQRADPGRDRQFSVPTVYPFQPPPAEWQAHQPAEKQTSVSQMTSAQLLSVSLPLLPFPLAPFAQSRSVVLYLTLLQTPTPSIHPSVQQVT